MAWSHLMAAPPCPHGFQASFGECTGHSWFLAARQHGVWGRGRETSSFDRCPASLLALLAREGASTCFICHSGCHLGWVFRTSHPTIQQKWSHHNKMPPVCSAAASLSYGKMSHLVSGKYYRADLNFPSTLPKRKDGISHFEQDPPLSCCGIFQSRLVGKLDNILLQKQRFGKQAFIIFRSSYWFCSRKIS